MKFILCVLVFTLSYGVYHLTLFPSVSGGDSGELLAEACQLGTAHPPGYPTFTLLSHLSLSRHFEFFPRLYIDQTSGCLTVDSDPTTGWKMNNLTALIAAFSVVFIAVSIYDMLDVAASNSRWNTALTFTPSAVSALLYAFSPLMWEHSVGAEVFALNNLFCAMIIYLTIRVIISVNTPQTSSTQHLKMNRNSSPHSTRHTVTPHILLGAFVCGLALSNQHASLLLLLIAVPSVLLATASQTLDAGLLFLLACSFVLGLTSYNYLFLASLNPKPGSWGDLGNLQGLLGHVLRTEYGTFSLGMTLGAEGFLERIWIYVLHLLDDGSCHVLLPLALIGVLSLLYNHNAHRNLSVPSDTKRRRIKGAVPSQAKHGKTKGENAGKPTQKKVPTKQTGAGSHYIADKKSATSARSPQLQEAATKEAGRGKERTINDEASLTAGEKSALVATTSHLDGQYWSVVFLTTAWVFYVVVWNGVLSNIPLSAPMPYGVHARFWMQPNIIVFIFSGLGISSVMRLLFQVQSSQEEARPFKEGDAATHGFLGVVIQCGVVAAVFAVLMHSRFDVMDKSHDGWIMHDYGNFILQSTTANSNSLLLSHTDLNWNTIRYLQVCEGVKNENDLHSLNSTHSTHLNFQLMPFPWFPKQQSPLYPEVTFPPMFQGVSTQRMTTENAYLVDRFLNANINFVNERKQANMDTIWGDKRPLFLDMQAINDLHIDAGGTWRNLTLVPWGLVYLVHERKSIAELGAFHNQSLRVLKILRRKFLPLIHGTSALKSTPSYNLTNFFEDIEIDSVSQPKAAVRFPFLPPRPIIPFMTKFPPGSWEHAAISTFHDGHNQLGLNLLSYSMEMQKIAKTHGDLLIIIDRLFVTADLLLESIRSIESLVEQSAPVDHSRAQTVFSDVRYSEGHAPLSTPFVHLLKNTGLSLMRLEALLVVAVKFQDRMREIVTSKDPSAVVYQKKLLLEGGYLVSKFTEGELMAVRQQAVASIQTFLRVAGDDKDIPAFQKSLAHLQNSAAT